MDKERTLVVVGVGRVTDRTQTVQDASSPAQLFRRAALLAAADAGLSTSVLQDVELVGTVDMFFEQRWAARFGSNPYRNFPRTVATAIGANRVRDDCCWRAFIGGNGPQLLVNKVAELISTGKAPKAPILIGGAEANHAFDSIARAGKQDELVGLGWCDSDEFAEATPKPVVRA
jgi:hypothetical protein